jgi:hypothetical protein
MYMQDLETRLVKQFKQLRPDLQLLFTSDGLLPYSDRPIGDPRRRYEELKEIISRICGPAASKSRQSREQYDIAINYLQGSIGILGKPLPAIQPKLSYEKMLRKL